MLSVPLPGQVDAVTVSFVQEATFPGVPAKAELELWQSGRLASEPPPSPRKHPGSSGPGDR